MKEALMRNMKKKVVTKVKAKNFALLALGNIMGSEKSQDDLNNGSAGFN